MIRLAATSVLFAALLSAANPLQAQAPPTTALQPPVLPFIVSYRYWPVQFVQWVGNELPYSMIELDVDSGAGKHPLLYVTLTERASGKRIHYTDNDALIATAQAVGEEGHKTGIAFEPADTEVVGSISTLRFTTADGKPLQWRFVQGSDISEQGSGLSPLPEAKIPIFAYREQAAVAGEGTALQVADTVSTAPVWTEISQPPYFVAYHGAESQSAHTLVFLPGQETWTVSSTPPALSAGATWELDEAHGNHRSLNIDKVVGNQLTITSTDRFAPGVRCTYDAVLNGDGWALDHLRFSPVRDGDRHLFALQFATPWKASSNATAFSLVPGKKKPVASGTLSASDAGSTRAFNLSFSTPGWLAGKSLTEERSTTGNGFTLSAHP